MKLKTILVLVVLIGGSKAMAQSKKEMQVAAAVEQLKEAMINPDSAKLVAMVSDDLSYGHSSGKIEDKKSFIHTLVSGQSDFVTINLTDQKIHLHKNTAVVTHKLDATNNDGGKPGTVKLSIMTVWVKQNGNWQLVSRQAVKAQ